jgi:hypothetical protein
MRTINEDSKGDSILTQQVSKHMHEIIRRNGIKNFVTVTEDGEYIVCSVICSSRNASKLYYVMQENNYYPVYFAVINESYSLFVFVHSYNS